MLCNFHAQTLTSVCLSQYCVPVKQLAPTSKEASPVSAHLVSLVMEGVMEMDAQVENCNMHAA